MSRFRVPQGPLQDVVGTFWPTSPIGKLVVVTWLEKEISMSRGTGDYSQGKRRREAEKERKKKEKRERRRRNREMKDDDGGIPVASVEEIQAAPPARFDEGEGEIPLEPRTRPAPRPRPKPGRSNARLFIGGISWNTNEEELKALFNQVGTVTDAIIMTDRDTGRSRGFGFVTMSTKDEAMKAIQELDGAELDGRRIRVNEATDRGR